MKRLHKRLAQLEAQLRYGANKLSKSQLFGIVQKILVVEAAIAISQPKYTDCVQYAVSQVVGRYVTWSEIQKKFSQKNPFLPRAEWYEVDGVKLDSSEINRFATSYQSESQDGYTYLDYASC